MLYLFAILKVCFHATVLLTLAAPFFLVWSFWRISSGLLALPQHLYQIGDDILFHFYLRVILVAVEDLVGLKVYFYGDISRVVKKRERAVYLVNYQSTFDWIGVNLLAERAGSLGNLRYIIKQSLQSVPLYGFYFYQHGCIYVNNEQINKSKMKRALAYLADKNVESSVVLFPEGIRFDPNNNFAIKMSVEYAMSKELRPMKQVLMPRTRGAVTVLQTLKKNMDAVYTVTLIYDGTRTSSGHRLPSPSLFDVFAGKCKDIHIHVKRTSMNNVPDDATDIKQFVLNEFYEQDALLDSYYSMEPDEYPAELSVGAHIPYNSAYNTISVIISGICLSSLLFTNYGFNLLWKTWVFGSVFGYSWLGMISMA
ncbi:1-acyl-sn-glycerol-3-phosphate acyltransferase epsilon-like [Ornithodoros turicata]|uniref:1-acyl-sn-glycerol-3-phosphate acyltransferase epsilon-like n=1 Tax=Ornithodoros turicata TaxID=34597 RepID=UPI003139D2FB